MLLDDKELALVRTGQVIRSRAKNLVRARDTHRSLLSSSKGARDLLNLSRIKDWAGKGAEGMKASLRLLIKLHNGSVAGEEKQDRERQG
jgi:hypothetical protein